MTCEQIKEVIEKIEQTLKVKDAERRQYKEKHGILTQEEREAMQKQQKHRQKV